MSGIQYVTDDKGRKVGVPIDLKKHGATELPRKEKGIPYAQYRATRLKRTARKRRMPILSRDQRERSMQIGVVIS